MLPVSLLFSCRCVLIFSPIFTNSPSAKHYGPHSRWLKPDSTTAHLKRPKSTKKKKIRIGDGVVRPITTTQQTTNRHTAQTAYISNNAYNSNTEILNATLTLEARCWDIAADRVACTGLAFVSLN